MNVPESLQYTKDHEWLSEVSTTKAKIGVTSFAIEQLGDIVHIELPKVGASVQCGDAFGTIESTKTVSDLYMPVTGKVVAVNEKILSAPESLQSDCYDQGWLIEVESSTLKQTSGLLTASQYKDYITN